MLLKLGTANSSCALRARDRLPFRERAHDADLRVQDAAAIQALSGDGCGGRKEERNSCTYLPLQRSLALAL